jgi:hypothetical protein
MVMSSRPEDTRYLNERGRWAEYRPLGVAHKYRSISIHQSKSRFFRCYYSVSLTEMIVKRTPVRLIVCVDGTWFNPDGLERTTIPSSRTAYTDSATDGKTGSLSNVFRTYTSVQEGPIETQNVVQVSRLSDC